MSHAKRCILRHPCVNADTPSCSPLCTHFIAIHGTNGNGGRVANANVPKDYRNLTLLTASCRDDQSDAYESIQRYVSTFIRQFEDVREALLAEGETEQKIRIKSLYLYSESPGTGKTTTASAILNEWLTVHYIGSLTRNRQPHQRPAYFLDINEWQSLYNGFNRSGIPQEQAEEKAREYYRIERYAREAPFLVADDIGVRKATEGFRGDLHGIVNYRVTNELPTVYTSNIPMSELADVFDARLADRISDMCVEIPFKDGSKRGMRK
jgi:DNA replication protein DnaC